MIAMILLVPIAALLLIYSMVCLHPRSLIAIVSYVLSAYTLTVWCCKIPFLIHRFKTFKAENKYYKNWQSNPRLRINFSLYGALIFNIAYAALQFGMGLWHRTVWFFSLAIYYCLLAIMRFYLVGHTRRHSHGEKMLDQWKRYRFCGIIFLMMNLTLSVIVFFMIYWNRTFHHHQITTIALAAYTFTALTVAIINVYQYRKYNSPVYSASKAISLTAACGSMLTLTSTMLTAFDNGTMDLIQRRILLGVSGGTVSLLMIMMAIYMIVQSTKNIRLLQAKE